VEIVLEYSWQDSAMKFYIISINTGGHARLEGLPVMQTTENSKNERQLITQRSQRYSHIWLC
jgi:hypothetical protein